MTRPMMRHRTFSLALLLIAAFAPMLAAQRGPSEEWKEKARIRIGITKEQQAQIDALFAETERQNKEVGAKMRDLYHQLYSLYENYDYDRNQAAALRKEIHGLYKRRMMIHAENEDKLRRILNREQFDKLHAMMREMHDQFRRDRQRSGGPGGPPGFGGPGGPGPKPEFRSKPGD